MTIRSTEQMPDSEPAVTIQDLVFAYVSPTSYVHVIDRLSLTVEDGAIACLVGPSGCGKSTLFNILMGRLQPNSGQVRFGGEGIARKADIGYMTQDDLLLPWLTAVDNAALGLRFSGVDKAERRERAREMLGMMGLGTFERAYPHQLSGGMRQRVALARTLLTNPNILLLDEPFSRVDAQVRLQLESELLSLQARTQTTVLLITHDIEEAIAVGDLVYVLSPRPMSVVATYPVPIDGRKGVVEARQDPRFGEIMAGIWSHVSGHTAAHEMQSESLQQGGEA